MKSKIYSFIVMMLVFVGAASAQWVEVPLPGGGFEIWTDDQPDGWEMLVAIDPADCESDNTITASTGE